MVKTRISKGGQVTIPAAVRRRWGATELVVEDTGDTLVLRPIPADPIGAALGSLRGPSATSEALRVRARREDAAAERRRRHAAEPAARGRRT